MEPDRDWAITLRTPQDEVAIWLTAAEMQAIIIVLGTAPEMMLDAGKGTEIREALAALSQVTRRSK